MNWNQLLHFFCDLKCKSIETTLEYARRIEMFKGVLMYYMSKPNYIEYFKRLEI